MPVPLEPFLMTQNICPGETFFMDLEQVKLRGAGFKALPNFPFPAPVFPWHILQAMGLAVLWNNFFPARASALAGIAIFTRCAGADLVLRGCGQSPPASTGPAHSRHPAVSAAIHPVVFNKFL